MYRLILSIILLVVVFTGQCQQLTYLMVSKQAEPFQIVNTDKGGIITDIVNQIFLDSDMQIQSKDFPFLRLLRMMNSDSYPHWINYGSPVWQSYPLVNIQSKNLSSEPLFNVSQVLITKSSSPLRIDSIEDLFGKTVITLKGFSYPGLDEELDNGKIDRVIVSSHESALRAILADRGVAFISMDIRARYTLLQSALNIDDFNIADFSNIIPPYAIHLSFSDSFDEKLKKIIDNRIIDMKKNHQIEKIIATYTSNQEQ